MDFDSAVLETHCSVGLGDESLSALGAAFEGASTEYLVILW